MRERNKELDLLKGIAVFLMVFDHVGWGKAVHTYIQSFHMPLFFIVSGYLWKDGQSIEKVIKKGLRPFWFLIFLSRCFIWLC